MAIESLFVVNPRKRKKAAHSGPKLKRNRFGQFLKRGVHANPRPAAKRKPKTGTALAAHKPRRAASKTGSKWYPVVGHLRNPRDGLMSGLLSNVAIPVGGGLAGALVVDLAVGYLPIPTTLMTGQKRNLLGAALGIGLGVLGRLAKKRRFGDSMMVGALIVASRDSVHEFAAQHAPSVKLGAYANPLMVDHSLGMFDQSTGGGNVVTMANLPAPMGAGRKLGMFDVSRTG